MGQDNKGLNVRELRVQMVKKGHTVKQLLEKTGIERRHFYRVLNGVSAFNQNEIAAIMLVLGLSPIEVVDIFLM